jgi:hypothetical protein
VCLQCAICIGGYLSLLFPALARPVSPWGSKVSLVFLLVDILRTWFWRRANTDWCLQPPRWATTSLRATASMGWPVATSRTRPQAASMAAYACGLLRCVLAIAGQVGSQSMPNATVHVHPYIMSVPAHHDGYEWRFGETTWSSIDVLCWLQ